MSGYLREWILFRLGKGASWSVQRSSGRKPLTGFPAPGRFLADPEPAGQPGTTTARGFKVTNVDGGN